MEKEHELPHIGGNRIFRMINEADSGCLKTAYGGFISSVISLCHECADRNQAAITLAYTENELQYHNTLYTAAGKSMTDLYVRKALAFCAQDAEVPCSSQVPPLTSNIHPPYPHSKKQNTEVLQWTGNTLDLVELVYGLSEMGCIDNGETPLKVLAPALYEFFGLRHQGSVTATTPPIKLRKNPKPHLFHRQDAEELNEKIRRDEELERMRR